MGKGEGVSQKLWDQRLFWDHFQTILGLFWDYFWTILGPFLDYFGIILGLFWDLSGTIFGQFWNHFRTIPSTTASLVACSTLFAATALRIHGAKTAAKCSVATNCEGSHSVRLLIWYN